MTEREIRREVERAFYEYKERKQKAAEYIAEAATNNMGVDYSRIRVSGGSADFDGKIITILDKYNREYLWCRVVELTKERYATDSDNIFIIEKYYKGAKRNRRSRLLFISNELYVSERQLYRNIREILNYASLLALQFGLVQVINNI